MIPALVTITAIALTLGLPGGVVVFAVSRFQKDLAVKKNLSRWSLWLILGPILLFTAVSILRAFIEG